MNTQNPRSLVVVIAAQAALLLLNRIEAAFNLIWRARQNRSAVSSFLLYWAILSLGPLLLGMGLASSTYLLSMQFLVEDPESLGLMSGILKFMPYVLTTAAFTLLFVAVPNCRVPIRHGLVGGLIAAGVGDATLGQLSRALEARDRRGWPPPGPVR